MLVKLRNYIYQYNTLSVLYVFMFWYVMNLSNLTPPVDYFFDNNYPFHWTKNQWLNTKVSHSFYCCYFPKKTGKVYLCSKKDYDNFFFRNLVFSHLFLVNDLSNGKDKCRELGNLWSCSFVFDVTNRLYNLLSSLTDL